MIRRISTKLLLAVLAAVVVQFLGFSLFVNDTMADRQREVVLYSLKGLAGNISDTQLYPVTVVLETEIKRAEEQEQHEELVERVEDALARVVDSARTVAVDEAAEAAAARANAPAELDRAAAGAALSELAALLRDSDLEAEEHLERARGQLAGAASGETLQRLTAQVNQFDFEAALETLTALAQELELELEGEGKRR